jgi:hypothetical protein
MLLTGVTKNVSCQDARRPERGPAKHVKKDPSSVISTERRNLSQIPRIRSGWAAVRHLGGLCMPTALQASVFARVTL